jgi:hypothetical protein
MVRVCIREVAQQRLGEPGAMAYLQREAKITPSLMRRYWHNSRTGRCGKDIGLRAIRLDVLEAMARVLGVAVVDLLVEE